MINWKISLGTLALSVAALAAPITVHNTGVDGTDVVQSTGTTTSFWTLLSQPAGAGFAIGSTPFRFYNGAYYADNAISGWVSPGENGTAGTTGVYVYQLSFDLTGLDPSSAAITGTFGTDNNGSIALNGNAAVASTGFASFASPTSFAFTNGFVAGVNTIQIATTNGGDPTAFRVEFTSATANTIDGQAPEPASIALLFGGLAVLWSGRKRFVRG